MKKALCALLFLTACNSHGGVTGEADPQKYLASLDGPDVQGIDATLLKSARASEANDDFGRAANYYKQLSDKNPAKIEYKLALAEAIRRSGEPAQALPFYDAVLAQQPTLPAAQEGKALALMERGDADAAERMFTALRTSGTGGWRTCNALGILTASHQSPSAALPYFDEALHFSPGNPSILNNLGLTQALDRHFDVATANLLKATQASEAKPTTRRQIELNTALVYAASGQVDKAEIIAKRYFEGAALQNNMAFYAHMAQDDQLARTYLDMALSQSKTFYQRAWNNLQTMPSRNGAAAPGLMPPQNIFTAPPPAAVVTPLPALPPTPTNTRIAAPSAPITPAPAASLPVSPPLQTAAPSGLIRPPDEPNSTPATVIYSSPPAIIERIPPSAPLPHASAHPTTPATLTPEARPTNGFQSMGNWIGSLVD